MSVRTWLFKNSIVERLTDEVLEMRTQVNRLRVEVAQLADKPKQQSAINSCSTKGKDMAEFSTYGLTAGGEFEVVRIRDGKFLVGPGFKSEAEAVERVTKLCAEYPMDEFAVYGVIRSFKANIPVDEVRRYDAANHENNPQISTGQ